jgi:hypothetical protein
MNGFDSIASPRSFHLIREKRGKTSAQGADWEPHSAFDDFAMLVPKKGKSRICPPGNPLSLVFLRSLCIETRINHSYFECSNLGQIVRISSEERF